MDKRIKELRKLENLSQDKFANKLGVSRSVIANIEYGKVEPKDYLINLIITTFGVNKEWLIHGIGDIYSIPLKERELAELMYELSQSNSELYEIVISLKKLEPEYFDCIKKLISGLPKKES
ncbi:helix-turn-helix transcriptional regulator [uncultured Clostridium sp.]|uniref:helix-turn-helix transcriptional regulator n=1 Tax=uncultured Clostridium sp. TaxID=59620 RepID=UPI002604E4B7|nr:helix-turn-helix transcriptional regulator [uncultured Clostridium sp.]